MTRVKICGITCIEDATVAVGAGADFLGFIFYPPSSRCVTPDQVRDIIGALRQASYTVLAVGVFVDEELGQVRETVEYCGLDYAQLHGEESPGYLAALSCRTIKAVRVRSEADVAPLANYRAAAYLLDAYHPAMRGGTGLAWNWELAVAAKRFGPVILAGGLTPENVAEAVRRVRPYAVDVSTGVESRPGRKDAARVRQFVVAAKSALPESDVGGDDAAERVDDATCR